MKTMHLLATSIALVAAVGCASGPPKELAQARSAYKGASRGPAPYTAPADLNAARETLSVAEQSYDLNGNNDETRDIAYAAQRRAQFADVRARTALAAQKVQSAQVEEQSLRDQQAKNQSAEMMARMAAERARADEAERMAAAGMKEDSRGKVMTLSGSVLFATGKSQLLPSAQKRLQEVADVLSQEDQRAKIRIEGFTDSTGSAATNERLSQARADSVKTFLSSHGVTGDRITTAGMGPSNPVADNGSAEGRANNRRVEIIIQNAEAQGGPMR